MPSPPSKACFIVSQIGSEDSPERVHADWFLEEIVEPTFESLDGFKVERADTLSHPGLIDAQIIQRLLTAEIVIADLTGLNPNVFYEIGIRHMSQKPIIHMHEAGQSIPFDVSLYRSIAYSRLRPKDLRQARANLSRAIGDILAPDYQVENPVTNVRGRFQLELHATPEQKLIIGQLQSIERRIASLEEFPNRSNASVNPYLATQTIDPNYVSPIMVGDYVQHKKFGLGPVLHVEGSKIIVDFVGGRKKVIDAFLNRVAPPDVTRS